MPTKEQKPSTTAIVKFDPVLEVFTKQSAIVVALKKQEIQLVANLLKLLAVPAKDRNQEWIDSLDLCINRGKDWVDQMSEAFEPFREAAHSAHKLVVKTINENIDDVNGKVAAAQSAKILAVDAARRERDKRQAEIDAEQRRINQQRADEEARLARKAGADKQAQLEIKETILSTPAPIVEAKIQAPSGTTLRKIWDVDPTKYDLWALVKAAAKDKSLLPLLDPNWKNLRGRAVEGKEAAIIPGFNVRYKLAGTESWTVVKQGESDAK